ncbi:M17 family peptidase N-terminal domain-containing protein [Chloroflexota bacterium]
MEIKVIAGDIAKITTEAIVLYIFEGTELLDSDIAGIDRALDGAIRRLVGQGEIKGKPNEVTLIHSLGKIPADRVVIAGLGKKPEFTLERIRDAAAVVCRQLQRKKVATAATALSGAGIEGVSLEPAAQAVTEGVVLGGYSFRRHMTGEAETGEVKELTIVTAGEADLSSLERGSRRGKVMGEATNLARDMVNEPANFMTPGHMAAAAVKLAGTYGLEVDVLEREQMQELGMGGAAGGGPGELAATKVHNPAL